MRVVPVAQAAGDFAVAPRHNSIKTGRAQYGVWLTIASLAHSRLDGHVERSHPKVSILKGGRVVFNIKGNDYRLVAAIQYRAGALPTRVFGRPAEHDTIV